MNESKIAQGDGRRCWGWAGTGDNRSCEYFMMMNPSFGTCIISATMTQLYRAVNTRHVNSRDGSLFLCSYLLFLVIASNCFAWILFYQISVQTGLKPSVCILLPPSCSHSLFPGPLISWEADEIIGGAMFCSVECAHILVITTSGAADKRRHLAPCTSPSQETQLLKVNKARK